MTKLGGRQPWAGSFVGCLLVRELKFEVVQGWEAGFGDFGWRFGFGAYFWICKVIVPKRENFTDILIIYVCKNYTALVLGATWLEG